ncbi:MAG TPA: MFS transporter [Kocuria rosea]|nr:MFS transporter [Kocuria rosea]
MPASRGSAGALFRGGNRAPTAGMRVMCLLSLLSMSGLTTWLPQIMDRSGSATGSAVSFLLTYSIGALAGTVVAAVIVQRTAPKAMVVVGFVSAATALLIASPSSSPAVLTAAVLVAGLGGMGTQSMVNDHIPRYHPAAVRATGLGPVAGPRRGRRRPPHGAWAITVGGGGGGRGRPGAPAPTGPGTQRRREASVAGLGRACRGRASSRQRGAARAGPLPGRAHQRGVISSYSGLIRCM